MAIYFDMSVIDFTTKSFLLREVFKYELSKRIFVGCCNSFIPD